MRKIAIAVQKGGASKTTLLSGLGVYASSIGHTVAMLDLDKQRSLAAWYTKRRQKQDKIEPGVLAASPQDLTGQIPKLESSGIDYLMMDTQGADTGGASRVIEQSDFCIVPVRPTPADIDALKPTLVAIQKLNKPFGFVLTQTPATINNYRIGMANAALENFSTVAEVPMVMRADYQDAFGLGLGPTELAPNGKAAKEIQALWKWLDNVSSSTNQGNG